MDFTITEAVALAAAGAERRRHPRMPIVGELQGEQVPGATPLVVLDLSEGGFAVESPVPFKELQEYRIRFSTTKRSHGIFRAINVHSMHATMVTGPVYYAGFQFADADDAVAIRAMIAEVREIRTASRA